ncbi:MAG: T9SS type A sorting domain-containing protein [Bacteroidetes bacterium]|nr:T9SS type A sorting domain-containing protein [Bacteroidota bacterium]
MGLTGQTTFGTYVTALTVVKPAFTYTPVVQTAGNFDMITLTTPFTWDGSSSIVVNTCTGSNPFTSPYGGLRYTTATGTVIYNRVDGGSNCAATSLGSTTGNRPNIRFDYVAGTPCTGTPTPGSIATNASYCNPGVVSLTATGYTTGVSGISFQWEESDDNGGGDPWADVVGGTGAITASYTSPSLVGNTIYYRLKVTCSGSDAWTNECLVSPSDCQFDPAYNTGISYSSIAGTGTNYTFSGTSTDDNTSAAVSLSGTTFTYKGQPVSGLKACTNGWLTFNTASTATDYLNNIGSSSTSLRAIVAPFWEDLVCQGNPGTTAGLNACMKYEIVGTLGSGSAQIICEWIGMETYNNAGPNLNFQVVLDENGNTITFNYGTMEGFNGSSNFGFAYSVGLNGWTFTSPTTYTDLMALRDEYTTNFDYTPATSSNSGLNAKTYIPLCNSQYVFSPIGSYAGPGVAPTYTPGNDENGSATALTVNTGGPCTSYCETYYESRGATASSGIPVCSAGSPGTPDDDVWFYFNATTSSQTITIRPGGGYDAVVQLLDQFMTPLYCVNAVGAGLSEVISATGLNPSDPYFVRVYHSGAGSSGLPTVGYTTSGIAMFSICVNEVIPPPANDNICGAVGLTVGATCTPTSGTSITATASPQAVCGGTADDDVWYSFVAPVANPVVTVQSGTGYNAHLQVFSSSDNTCTGTLTSLGCVNSSSTGGVETFTGSGLSIGNTYFIRIYHTASGAATGVFTVCVTATVPSCASGFSPANGANASSTTQTLSWSAVSGATGYDVYLDPNAPATTLVSPNQAGTTYVATVSGGNTYNWLVIAKNAIGDATGCTEISFTTNAPACIASPSSPSNAGTSCESVSSTTLSWPSASGASGYDVYFDAGAGPAMTLVSPNQVGTTYAAGILGAGSYAWKVVPKNDFGDASGCSDWTFTVTPAPAGDVMGTAIAVTLPATGTGDNFSSNCWHNDYTTANTNGRSTPDVYYTFTTGPCDNAVTIDLSADISADTYLHLLDAGGNWIASDDDGGASATSLLSNIPVTANTTYIFVIETYSSEGTYAFSVTTTASTVAPSFTVTNVTCNGANDGVIVVTGTGGVAPYTGEGTFSGLAPGSYSYTVTDVNGCSGSGSATITEPTALSAACTPTNENFPGSNDGTVTVVASGGTTPYSGDGLYSGLAAGTYTYTVTDFNGCTSSCTATVGTNCVPSTPATSASASASEICSGNNVILSLTGGSLGTGASWKWYEGGCGAGAVIGTGSTITTGAITGAGVHTFYARAEGLCGTTTCVSVSVTVTVGAPIGSIAVISFPASGCVGGTATMTCTTVPNATGYSWSGPAGILFDGNPSPYVSTSTTVTLTYAALPPAGISGWNVCVFAKNACGNSLNTKCSWIRATVSTPNYTAAPVIGCPSTTGIYTVATVDGATSYNWSITGGNASINGAGASTSTGVPTVNVAFGAGFTGGTLCVSATTACGYTGGSRCVNIGIAPLLPGVISGSSTICPGGSSAYTIAAVANATSYVWTATGTGVSVVGSGTSATVSTTGAFISGSVCVSAVSACGASSPQRCKTIGTGKLGTPGNITGDPTTGVCGQTWTYSIPSMAGATGGYTWTLPAGATGSSSTNSITVTFPAVFSSGTLCVHGNNGCGAGPDRCVTVFGNPGTPASLSGNSTPCIGFDEVYTWPAVPGATQYQLVVPVGYTVLSGNPTISNMAVINIGGAAGSIGVKAENTCGVSGTRTLALSPVSCRLAGNQPEVVKALATHVYPNPTTGMLNVQFNSASNDQSYMINVLDLSGRVVLATEGKANEGSNLQILDLSHLAKGMYMISLQTNEGNQLVRVSVE